MKGIHLTACGYLLCCNALLAEYLLWRKSWNMSGIFLLLVCAHLSCSLTACFGLAPPRPIYIYLLPKEQLEAAEPLDRSLKYLHKVHGLLQHILIEYSSIIYLVYFYLAFSSGSSYRFPDPHNSSVRLVSLRKPDCPKATV